MSDMRPIGQKITLGGKEYGLRFTLNAVDDIQDKFDIAISELGTLFDNPRTQLKNIKYLLMVLINEDMDCVADETGVKAQHVDERFIGRHIDTANSSNVISSIYKAFANGTPEPDPNA